MPLRPPLDLAPGAPRLGGVRAVARLALGLILCAGLVYLGGAKSLAVLSSVRLGPALAVLLSTAVIVSLISLRWRIIAGGLASHGMPAFRDFLRAFMLSRALGFVVPKDLSDIGVRAAWLQRAGKVSLATAAGTVALDRLLDFVVIGLCLLGALPFWLGWIGVPQSLALIAALLTAGGVLLYRRPRLFAGTLAAGLAAAFGLLRRLPMIGARLPQSPDAALLGEIDLGAAYLLSALKLALTAARFALIATALALPLSPALIVLATPLSQVAYMVALTPGGLGIFELGWFAILTASGAAAADVVAFAIGQRVLILLSIAALMPFTVVRLGGRR